MPLANLSANELLTHAYFHAEQATPELVIELASRLQCALDEVDALIEESEGHALLFTGRRDGEEAH